MSIYAILRVEGAPQYPYKNVRNMTWYIIIDGMINSHASYASTLCILREESCKFKRMSQLEVCTYNEDSIYDTFKGYLDFSGRGI